MAFLWSKYDGDDELEKEETSPYGLPLELVTAYKKLVNCVFRGTYTGKNRGKFAVFELEKYDKKNKKISSLLSEIDMELPLDDYHKV